VLREKKNHHFKGSADDERGYSSTTKFCKLLINKSNLNQNFVYDYGNSRKIKVKQIAEIFKKVFEKNIKKKIKYTFNSNVKNTNIIKSNENVISFDTKENSHNIIKKYYLSKIKLYEK
jgi:hypothetical protein